MAKVRLFDGDRCIGMVAYTANLDHWDGHNHTSGSTGRHLGLGRTRSGKYYLCHGTQWQGERDYAEVVSEAQARETALRHDEGVYEEFFGPVPDLTDDDATRVAVAADFE